MRDRLAVRAMGEAGRPWIVWLPYGLAFVGAGLLAVAGGLAEVMGSWDTPAPGLGWLRVGEVGQGVLAAGTVAVLVTGVRQPRRRRAAAITAWLIIAVEFGWFLLTGRLAGAG